MKQFFKFLLAVILGGIVTVFLIFLILFGMIAGIATFAGSGEKQVSISENTILHMDLNTSVVERTTEDPFTEAMATMQDSPSPLGLNNILKNIKKAKEDDNIKGIYLETGMINAGFATIEEIRNALIDFKKSEKFIISFSPIYTQKSYYLASVSDNIYLNPGGVLEFKGLASQNVFLRGTLEKLGVEMQIVKHGKFKSAVEPFIRDNMSEPARLQTKKYVNSIWEHVVKKIGEERNLSRAELMAIADKMITYGDVQGFVDAGLIDALKYKDEVLDKLKELTDTKLKDDLTSISIRKYTNVVVPGSAKGFVKDKIAIIYAEGAIDGTSRDGIDSEKLSKAIRKARRDSSIKAIVFRVNSPGGSALGSEIIWREVKLTQEVKPVVVSMGDLAASGGYYISCAANTIVAHANTLTGSIGVFGLIPNTEGLMKKIGVTFDGVKTNKFADMPTFSRRFTKEERALMQSSVEFIYKTFITRCADGRETTNAKIDEIGQGRVWSGEDALNINLVDTIGGVNLAIDIAKQKAGLEKYRIVELPKIPNPFEKFMKEMTGNVKMFIGKSIMGDEYKYLQTIENLKSGYQFQARIPYNVEVY